jgi:protein-S-isoprenylcysteine O-methyltransferase Ste14
VLLEISIQPFHFCKIAFQMKMMETEGKMKDQQRIITPRLIIQMLFFIVVIPFLPLLISRDWDWWEAWVYAIISILGFVISRVLATRRHPDLIAERARTTQHEDTQPWDKQLAPLLGIGGVLVMLVCGLDELLDWSPTFSLSVTIIALIAILLGYVLGSYALIENRFFSGVVRLQADRGHRVVTSGPYRWIRHPGYAGALLTYLATPFFLDSSWAFLPTVFVVILFIIRTYKEDRFLQDELEGYHDYVKRVRYRLLPGVW